MSGFTERTPEDLAKSLTDELTPEEKSQIWNHIKEHSELDLQKCKTWKMTWIFRYTGRIGTVVAGLAVAAFLGSALFRGQSATNSEPVEGSTSRVGTIGTSFVAHLVGHLNILYIIFSIVVFLLCAWGMARLVLSIRRVKILRRPSTRIYGGKRWWLLGLVCLVGLSGSVLELMDQSQGGPLGREYARGGGIYGCQTKTDKTIVFGSVPLVNKTFFPMRIFSVQATSDVSGLAIRGGITTTLPTICGTVVPMSTPVGAELPPGVVQMPTFLPGTVELPSHMHTASSDHLVPVFAVTTKEPGYYAINGFTVTYRWGPIFYRTHISAPDYHLTVK